MAKKSDIAKSDIIRVNRRGFMKASAATGAALATGSVFAPSCQPHKASSRLCQSADRTALRICRG